MPMPTPEIRQAQDARNAAATSTLFLQLIFGGLWEQALITGFRGDPGNPQTTDWTAKRAANIPYMGAQNLANMFFCPSLTRTNRRQLSEFVSFHVIVIDDYGTKIVPGQPEKLLARQANYVIETSPGNYQAGWLIEPESDLAWVKGMLKKLKDALGAGDNLTDPMAWRRLPVGINGKAKYKTKTGVPWTVDLASEVYP